MFITPLKKFTALAFVFLFLSCASSGDFSKIDKNIERDVFSEAIILLESRKNVLYSQAKDAVLFYLDKGMLSHYAKEYSDSTELLQEAERAIEEAFTKSVSRELGSYLANDNTLEYPGEDYEDIYINAFNALNYYHLGKMESSLVEIRRMNEKVRYLATKYDVVTSELQQEAMGKGSSVPPNPDVKKFTDSALARFLGIIFYRSIGNYDSARVDSEGLKLAFANAPEVYKNPIPASIAEELNIPRGMARANVIAFSGLSPYKQAATTRIPMPGGRWAKISLPFMVDRSSSVNRIEVIFESGERFNLELLEDIAAVAKETFKQKENVIYLKTTIRAVTKALASSASQAVANNVDDAALSLALTAFSLLSQAYADLSEQADIRISRFFPGKAWVGAINLTPGVYSYKVNFYDKSNRVLATQSFQDVEIKAGTLNLFEAVCLR